MAISAKTMQRMRLIMARMLDETYSSEINLAGMAQAYKSITFTLDNNTTSGKSSPILYYPENAIENMYKKTGLLRERFEYYGRLFHVDPIILCSCMYLEDVSGMMTRLPVKGEAYLAKNLMTLGRSRQMEYKKLFINDSRCCCAPQIHVASGSGDNVRTIIPTKKANGELTINNNNSTFYDALFMPMNCLLDNEKTPEFRAEAKRVQDRFLAAFEILYGMMTNKSETLTPSVIVKSSALNKAGDRYEIEMEVRGNGQLFTGVICKITKDIITSGTLNKKTFSQSALVNSKLVKFYYQDPDGNLNEINRDRFIYNGKFKIVIAIGAVKGVRPKLNVVKVPAISIYNTIKSEMIMSINDQQCTIWTGDSSTNYSEKAHKLGGVIGNIYGLSGISVTPDMTPDSKYTGTYTLKVLPSAFWRAHFTVAPNDFEAMRNCIIPIALILAVDLDMCIFICASVYRWKIGGKRHCTYNPANDTYYTKERLAFAVGAYLGTAGKDSCGSDAASYTKRVLGDYIQMYSCKTVGEDFTYSQNMSIENCRWVSNATGEKLQTIITKFGDMTDINTGNTPPKLSDETFDDWLNKVNVSIDTDLGNYKGYTEDKDVLEAIKKYYESMSNIKAVNLAGIIGMPPRFPDIVDPRLSDYDDKIGGDIYGPIYTKLYLEAGHLVTITPGVPEFLQGFNMEESVNISTAMIFGGDGATDGDKAIAAAAVSDATAKAADITKKARAGGTLFGFKLNYVEYTNIVKMLNYATAVMFGITDYEWYSILDDNERAAIFKGVKPKPDSKAQSREYYDPTLLDKNDAMTMSMIDSGAMPEGNSKEGGIYNTYIYNNGPIGMSESVSNTVGQSQMSQMIGLKANETMKDMTFLMNTPIASKTQFLEKIKTTGWFKSLMSDNSVLGKLGTNVFGMGQQLASIAGANIKLPDVFKDSSYSKTFEIKIKLTSPNNDRLSFFKYIMTEFNRIAPYVLPKQYGAFVDAQLAPYLIQVYSRGLVACELAMCTQLDIIRNPENMSLNRYPTEVDLVLTIKDLSPVLSIPMNAKDIQAKFDRTFISSGIIPYLSTYAGIPLYRSDNMEFWQRKFYKLSNIGSNIISTPEKAVQQFVSNKMTNIKRAIVR